MTTATTSRLTAKAYAVSFEIMCPNVDAMKCDRSGEPIPDERGSHVWKRLPETVTCPNCHGTFKVGRKIHLD